MLLISNQFHSIISNLEHQSVKIETNNDDEIAVITFADALHVGPGELKLQFSGPINDLMKGCYRSKYTTPDGEVRYGLSTKFESTFCSKCKSVNCLESRFAKQLVITNKHQLSFHYLGRAFPCWDEPELKAKFDITLVAPKDRVALSNMNVVEETDDLIDPTKRVLKFATTPVMSTYLVCYIVGEYEFIEQITKNNIRIRVFTPLGKTEQGKFALDIAVRCLEFYEEYFNIPYPLPKLDLIAIADFPSGAMEVSVR